MTGRAETRTPEPPGCEEHEDSPPRLSRPKRTTRPPKNYERIELGDRRDVATSDDAATEREELDVSGLVREIAKFRREIRLRDEIHKEELQRTREEFSASLAEVRHELQTLTDRNTTPQCHSETCSQNNHDEILREIQSLREEIGNSAPTGSPSYADVARTPPSSYPSNIRTLSTMNTTRTTITDTLYCTIDTSKMVDEGAGLTSAGSVRAAVEAEMRSIADHAHWRCRAVTVDPKNANRIRIACRDEDEQQLVKKVAEQKIGAGARVLRDELYPIKVDSVNKASVLDENGKLSSKENEKAYRSMVVYLTRHINARRLLADGFFHTGGESGVTSVFEYRPRPTQYYNYQEIGHKAF
ncbi:hypothetical protein N7540_013195 [Penicillium herquei]|nr:hypothetical protein N7540_013195 [Penicillium herquei]